MTENRVTIFANGIADFRRAYSISSSTPLRISLPVKQDHVADVLASLNVFGAVRIAEPPSFRPANAVAGTLDIDPHNAIEELSRQLAGSEVEVHRAGGTHQGYLLGLHTDEQSNGGAKYAVRSLVLSTSAGVQRIPLSEIERLLFVDADVNAEIEKSLRRRAQQIKPESTFVELSLAAKSDETEAVLQYTVPSAAWKISYRLHTRDGEHRLQGFAIVDNNTDEDWRDFRVAVVTGEPITFSTDLADSKTPSRKHVNVVKEQAFGAIEVEEAYMDDEFAGGAAALAAPSGQTASPRMLRAKMAAGAIQQEFADTAPVEAKEIGDFCLFESAGPVTIPANRSSAIPVFDCELSDSKRVLHYKHANHAERPFRAIRFRNETPHSLGRGVCTVFEDATYAGSCVLPACKPNQEQLLPHALDTGTRVRRDIGREQTDWQSLMISQGVLRERLRTRITMTYRFRNHQSQPAMVVLDHEHFLTHPEVNCEIIDGESRTRINSPESLAGGSRYTFDLAGNAEIAVEVRESTVIEQKENYITTVNEGMSVSGLLDHHLISNGPLAGNSGLIAIRETQMQIDTRDEEIEEANDRGRTLVDRQARIRENIKAAGEGEQANRWRADLAASETEITRIEEEIVPGLVAARNELIAVLKEQLLGVTLSWEPQEDSRGPRT